MVRARGFRLVLLAGLIGLAACDPRPAQENVAASAPDNAAANAARPAAVEMIDREALLLAVVRARSAAAAGADDAALQRELEGQRFEFRIRLGCALAPPRTPRARVTYDPGERRVEISARPDLTLDDPVVAAVAAAGAQGAQFEAAEGFRVAAPWLLVPHCAGRGPGAAAAAAVPAADEEAGVGKAEAAAGSKGETPVPVEEGVPAPDMPAAGAVGLVQFFTGADPRGARRDGRAYAARELLPEGAAAPEPGSWELVLTGRLQALPGGRVIMCQPAAPGAPPACVVSVRFDRVAIVNRVTGSQLAEWSDG